MKTRITFAVLAFLIASPAFAQAPIVARASQWVDKQPTLEHRIGLAEIQRANGLASAGIETLERAAKDLPAADPRAAALQELLCWRMLPITPATRAAFQQHVAQLKARQPANAWISVWELYLAAEGSSRAAILPAITDAPLPERFPAALAEDAHRALLTQLGQSRVQAGVDVIAARTYEPLHALRDLDRALTREAEFLAQSERALDVKQVIAARDRLRGAYHKASRHLVEKLFALHLSGNAKERDVLLAKAKALPYLHDRRHLAGLLHRLDDEQAWKLLIEPLLANELAVIDNPPDVMKLQTRNVASMQIKARAKTIQDKTVRYQGDVRLQIHAVEIACDQLTLLAEADPAAIVLTGSDNVRLRGVGEYPGGVVADRFSYHAETGTFSLGGDVRLHAHDKTVKVRTCTLTQKGEIRDARSWLDDFKACFTIDAKLELLPKITRVYDDKELPDEVRYLLALNLLRPHLTWHAPYLPPLPDGEQKKLRDKVKEQEWRQRDNGTPWQEALGGEEWMLTDMSPVIERDYREGLRAWYKKANDGVLFGKEQLPDVPIPSRELYFWRIRDARHADVARAGRLMQSIGADAIRDQARRWAAEIRRNNTVLTFDIAGAAPRNWPHHVLMDVRNAETVAFKLYRVQQPKELQYAAQTIGNDFLYRDHHLDYRGDRIREKVQILRSLEATRSRKAQEASSSDVSVPSWTKEQLVEQWSVRVADLRRHPTDHERRYRRHWDDDRWSNEADAHYFDDECSEHRRRIDKEYRPRQDDFAISSWQCDCVVRIPGNALNKSGAYVLVAESNGQTAHVPIVVDPLSLTLRRCRDGVFALVSDADGLKPLEGASVLPSQTPALADKEGVAFARVLAYGDRPIIAHHDGRYAIGGFGQVFEAIYEAHDYDRHYWLRDRLQRAKRGDSKDMGAHRYADRHVVVAYTDRPTYRPGQDVNFKLIVRKLEPTGAPSNKLAGAFRALDFDASTKMVLPGLTETIAYTVHDPKGHEIAHGSLKLSEFGTAAGKLSLNTESVVGAYSFRVRIAAEPRIVPEVFAVQHYRRPNFEVTITGVPETLTKPKTLTLNVSSRYYFGPPVTQGTVEVRVVRKDFGNSIRNQRGQLDEKGQTKLELDLPSTLTPGKYFVVCTITDESGRSVSTMSPLTLTSPDAPRGTAGLDALPRFVAVDHELKVASNVKEIRAQQGLTDLRFPVKAGFATLKFSQPGWYRLQAGDEESHLFVYGGKEHPSTFESHRRHSDLDHKDSKQEPRWVNLSDFSWQDDDEHHSRWENPDEHLFALFDKQTLKTGENLRLLVYSPYKRAKLLFTIEGRTILDYAVVWTKESAGAYQIVEIPIKERWFPNAYVQGRIVAHDAKPAAGDPKVGAKKAREQAKWTDDDDTDRDPRWCRIDVVRPAGKLDAGALNVQIETDAASYRPGDVVRAVVKVTDRDGRPASAELSVAAVDESVFAFGEDNLNGLPGFFHAPHEVRRFYPKVWRTSVGSRWSPQGIQALKDQAQMMDAMNQAIKSLESAISKGDAKAGGESGLDRSSSSFTLAPLPRLGGEMPSGQVPLAKLREHFHETAVWEPQLYTDGSGIARASFKLPDSLTRYRLTSVALTKTTDVGIGRARITAGLPLAVQVFLPRFAVEKDRVLAVAIVHNNSKQDRVCDVAWEIANASVDKPSPAPEDWKLVQENANLVGTGRVKVAANSSAKLGLWLKLDQIAIARIVFRASDGKESDAEVRMLPVQPLGRPAEVNENQALRVNVEGAVKDIAGKFHRDGTIHLPAGFRARELHLSMTASEFAQALDGLDYLIDYPHGCIEQTMSRFLPVVMIHHATQQAPIRLDPVIARKIPDILDKGLTRVYGFQHADGSWGWFEKDSRNLDMSAYVVYGLARCQATGVKIDKDVLKRGCDYLHDELRTSKPPVELAARAWYALALAGHADKTELAAAAKAEANNTGYWHPEAWCRLALACRAAGLNELGEKLWVKVSTKTGHWIGHDTESFALRLKTQLAFGAKYADCRDTSTLVLSKRTGTHWYHTRDTSWAIEALSNMLGYAADKATVRKIEITLAGKKIFEVKDAAELKKMTWRLRLSGDQLPAQEGLEIRMKADSDEPIYVAVSAVGVQRQDVVLASGKRVQLHRFIETLDGAPVRGPLKVGQVVRVRLRLDLEQLENYLLIEDRRPTLCEFAHDRIGGRSAASAVHQEFRDDRLCMFFTSLPAGTHEVIYYLRAETPGTCSVLPGSAYPMYDDKHRGETASNKLEVK